MSAQREAKSSRRVRRATAAVCLLVLAVAAPARAQEWVAGAKSQARLVDGGVHDGARYAGAQIRLSGEAVTYWRDPGEAGVAPTFDFAGSDNVGEAEVVYPQPERIDEAGQQAFGYRRDVVFPIRVAPVDPKKPMSLALKLDYAACEKICVPAHAQLSLTLPPTPQAAEAALLNEALRQAPKILEPEAAAQFASVAPAPPAGGKPQWRVRVTGGDARDLFVEAPTGFYFDVKPEDGKNAFLLVLAEHPGKKTRPELPLRITVSGPAPAEFDLALPPAKN
ncbi:protein-disulfide reductase DsbD domain-containing protein [Rhodoblastus sp.]|uniref:protein-disulfide reductase DsbD domain-containing protein n=1 Tax=Rhodoblastus sp. TaxID=1962975 RepID=UPI0035B14C4F